jgi:hypothetical protein
MCRCPKCDPALWDGLDPETIALGARSHGTRQPTVEEWKRIDRRILGALMNALTARARLN